MKSFFPDGIKYYRVDVFLQSYLIYSVRQNTGIRDGSVKWRTFLYIFKHQLCYVNQKIRAWNKYVN